MMLCLLLTCCPNAVISICIFLVLASPDREDVENASKVPVENNGADIQSDAHEQVNQEPSTVAANKVLEDQSSDLHETIASILKRDESRTGCLQSELIPEVRLAFLF